MADHTHSIIIKRITIHPHGYKTMRFYKYFKNAYYIPLIFGYNFLLSPISKSRLIRFIFAMYSLFISIGVSYVVLSYVKYLRRSPFIYVAVEYIATVSLLLFRKADRRAQFIKNLELLDAKLHVNGSYYNRLKRVTFIVIIIALCMRILYSTAICLLFKFYCDKSPAIIFFFVFILIAVDANQIPRLIIFHIIRHRMSLLRKRVECFLQKDAKRIRVINANDKTKNLAEYRELYENILDAIDVISPDANPFFLLSLFCSFPKIMLLLYNVIVVHQKMGVPILHVLVLSLEAVQWGLIPCLPGIAFEMTRAQVEKMKLFLLRRHKHCKDNILRIEIKDFLDYIELRPCRYCLYRLIPVDITLLVSLFNLCTTYLIVMIQFSHLFGNID